MKKKIYAVFAATAIGTLVWLTAAPQDVQKPASPGRDFETREVMIPARDGVRLHTLIFTPKPLGPPLPIILSRTPYGISGSAGRLRGLLKE